MHKQGLILFIFLILITVRVIASGGTEREKEADKLRNALRIEKIDSLRLKTLYKLSELYWEDSLSLAMDYMLQAKELAYQMNSPKFITKTLLGLGRIYQWNHSYERALEYYKQAIIENDAKDNPRIQLEIFQEMAMCYRTLKKEEEFLEYSKKGLTLAKEVEDTTFITSFYNSIGLSLLTNNKAEEAIKYLNQSYELIQFAPHYEDKNMRATLLNNIGMAYNQLGEYEKALDCIQKSLEIQKEQVNDVRENKVIFREEVYQNVNPKDLIVYIQIGIANTEINLGITYKNQGNYKLALEYIQKGLNSSLRLMQSSQIQKGYLHLSETYEKLGDNDSAFETYKKFIAFKDSLQTLENSQFVSKIESRIQAERAEEQVEQLRLENEIKTQRNRLINGTLLGGLFVTVIFGVIIYRRYREKQRLYQELEDKNQEIAAQNDQIIEKSNKLEEAYQDISEKNQHITDSINYAKRIQTAMLPTLPTIQQALPESFVFFKPRDIVSGDFYWFSEIDDKIIFAAVDCTGHGVPGALMAMTGDTHLDQIVNIQGITEADLILNALHKEIRNSLKQEDGQNQDGMALALCVINKKQKTVEFAGSKNPLFFVQNKEIQTIKGDKLAIGGYQSEEERKFQKHQLTITEENPTTFYMYSDGFQDQFGGENGKKFSSSRLKKLLVDIHQKSFSEQKTHLEEVLKNWVTFNGKNFDQIDDILVVGFKV